jgi:single-strand DNA-binding protein
MSSKVPFFNQLIVSGNLVADPIMRYIGEKDIPICNFTIANNKRYQDKNGNWQDNTTYLDVEAWSKTAERAGANLKKGKPVIIEGSVHLNRWEDSDGHRHQKHFVKAERVLLTD